MSTPRFDKEMDGLFATPAPAAATALAGLMEAEAPAVEAPALEAVGRATEELGVPVGDGVHDLAAVEAVLSGPAPVHEEAPVEAAEDAAEPVEKPAPTRRAARERHKAETPEAPQRAAEAEGGSLFGTLFFGAVGVVARTVGLGR